jgi:uncharacterized protein YciI
MPYYVRTLLITVSPEEAAEAVRQHHEHLRDLHDAGKLKAAGTLEGGDGFVEILDVGDLHEAEKLAAASPLIKDGLAAWILREWREIEFS